MKIVVVVALALSNMSLQAMSLAEIQKDIQDERIKRGFTQGGLEGFQDIPAWEESINKVIADRDKDIADFAAKNDSSDMRFIWAILISQAAEIMELTTRVKQVAIVPLTEPWSLFGTNEVSLETLMDQLSEQLEKPINAVVKNFKPIPKKWSQEIIEVKALAAMLDKHMERLKFVTTSKLNSVKNALGRTKNANQVNYLNTKLNLLQVVEAHINKINSNIYSPKKINESIQTFAEYLLTLSADTLPKMDDRMLSELEAPYRSYASILRGYLWGS